MQYQFLNHFLNSNIEYLKGVGPQKAEVIKSELGLFTFKDVLQYYPTRYVDKSKVSLIKEFSEESPNIQIRGVLLDFQLQTSKNGKRLSAVIKDSSGVINLVWFNNYQYVIKNLKLQQVYTVYGKVTNFNGTLSISHPEIKLYTPEDDKLGLKMEPVYPLTEKLKNRYVDSKLIGSMVVQIVTNPQFLWLEFIPDTITHPIKLISAQQAIKWIHYPRTEQEANEAIRRIKFEEMFVLAMRSEKNKALRKQTQQGIKMPKVGDNFNQFYKEHLTFELTNAQKRVIKEIKDDLAHGSQMNRLLQGDVGSGKTIVALLCMLLAKDNGHQSCLMAPTEILAFQHYITISDLLKDLPVNVRLLTGSTTAKDRREILSQLINHQIDILIGTHALIEDDVAFHSMGLAIIDEQHRFGVAQRAKLWKKSNNPHILVMTATPIPRTLAMTVHGELDVSIIDELPKDRKPIRTLHKDESLRYEVMSFVKTQIDKGRQIYIVYPLIEESSKLDLNDLMNGYDEVNSYFPVPKYQISLLHGKMKQDVKELEMNRFKNGITQIMVSTTVIEVGVNVPNASVMIIENANRFGLSQLHQLRGRVGRGTEQSFCILMTKDELNYPSKKRINTMCKTNDGFIISQVDLELRGPGDVLGTRQSGLPDFKLLDLGKDTEIIDLAKRAAAYLLKLDFDLKDPNHKPLLHYLIQHQSDHFWSQIS